MIVRIDERSMVSQIATARQRNSSLTKIAFVCEGALFAIETGAQLKMASR